MLSAPPHMVYIVLSNHMWFLLLHMCLHTSWHMFQPGHVTADTCYTSLHMYQPTHVTADTCYTSRHMLYQWTHVTAHTCSSQHMCKSGNHMWLNRPYKLEVVMQRTSVCGGMSCCYYQFHICLSLLFIPWLVSGFLSTVKEIISSLRGFVNWLLAIVKTTRPILKVYFADWLLQMLPPSATDWCSQLHHVWFI